MYNRVGRTLFIVGKQLRQKFADSTINTSVTTGCAATMIFQSKPHVFRRNYCYNESDESEQNTPKLMSRDQDGEIKLKEYLSVPENERTWKVIELEIEVMRQNSEKVPDNLKPRHWAEIIRLQSRSQRKRYYAFLWGLERRKENIQRTKEKKRIAREEALANGPCEQEFYSLRHNSLFVRFYDQTMNRMWNSRLINRMLFGQKIILDCGYEEHMTRREIKNCAKQLQLTFAQNRMHDDPFDMYLCNANLEGELMKTLHRSIPTMYDPDFPLNIKPASYLDLFDKKQLLYLTPHCNQEMHEFDHDTIYIVGAFVDKCSNEPVSMAKAKKEGLRMAKFPLDRHLHWGSSSGKNLTINQAVSVLLGLQLSGSWEKALQVVPRRKLFQAREAAMERRMQRNIAMQKMMTDNDEKDENVHEKILPVQEINPKSGYRFNADYQRTQIRSNYRGKFNRSNYQDNFNRSNHQDNSNDTVEKDFSMKSRTKFNANFKN